jgi:hypothetical protein
MPDSAFFDFVVNLVKLGGLGVGALIFVMAFLILFRNQAATPGMEKLRLSFLRFGFAFAALALTTSVVTQLVTSSRPSGKIRLGVTISPDFGEAKLPPPVLLLMPGGTPINPNTATEISSDTTLAIQVRGIVESVKGLESSSQTLLATNQKLTEAIDKSSQVVHEVSAANPPASTAAAAMTQIPVLSKVELANIKVTQNQISTGLAAGRFKEAAIASTALHSMTANARGLDK